MIQLKSLYFFLKDQNFRCFRCHKRKKSKNSSVSALKSAHIEHAFFASSDPCKILSLIHIFQLSDRLDRLPRSPPLDRPRSTVASAIAGAHNGYSHLQACVLSGSAEREDDRHKGLVRFSRQGGLFRAE